MALITTRKQSQQQQVGTPKVEPAITMGAGRQHQRCASTIDVSSGPTMSMERMSLVISTVRTTSIITGWMYWLAKLRVECKFTHQLVIRMPSWCCHSCILYLLTVCCLYLNCSLFNIAYRVLLYCAKRYSIHVSNSFYTQKPENNHLTMVIRRWL